ncbi:MAG: peptidoglycan-binding domain-containing protein [Geminicoccales bacterium]
MTSATVLFRYGLLAIIVNAIPLGIDGAQAQSDDAAEANADQQEAQPVDRGKLRLELLLSLVKNELRAATLNKDQLTSEQVNLKRERAELSAVGDQRRPADNVRLEQITIRLETIDSEMAAIDRRLPEINDELNAIQRRVDEANGVVRDDEPADDTTDIVEKNGINGSETTSASAWLDGKRQVQEALVYLGGYNALIDGDFGPRTAQAIKVYQKRQSLEETGTLTFQQEKALLNEARDTRILYGVEALRDDTVGYQVSYPTLLLSEVEQVSDTERRMATKDGKGELVINIVDDAEILDGLYQEAATAYEIQYRRKRDDWFVVAGLVEEDRIIYDTARKAGGKLVRARLTYPSDQRDFWSPFAVIIFNTLATEPTS